MKFKKLLNINLLTKQEQLDLLKDDGILLSKLGAELKSDPEIVLAAVHQNGFALQFASQELQNNFSIVFAAVQQDSDALEFASKNLQNDSEIVLAAVSQNGKSLQYASTELRNDREIVLSAVQQYGNALKFASEEMKDDREIVLSAVRQDGYALQFAGESCRNDYEILYELIKKDVTLFKYASVQTKAELIINKVIKIDPAIESHIPYPWIQYDTIIKTDKILIEKGMRDYGLYEVSRSTHSGIDSGEYFYAFDESDNLLMIKPPYRYVSTDKGNYIVFDSELYQRNEVIVIPKSEIVSFKLYGTELMQSSVKTNQHANVVEVKTDSSTPQYRSPSIIGTALSGFLFGSAYTILDGVGRGMHQQTNVLGNKLENLGDKLDDVVQAINSISISTNHQIIDTSRVQIVLSNRRDLEIDGVNIYYDLNRVYPNLGTEGSVKQSQSESASSATTTMTDEIMKLKKMLDEGLIDEEEFKAIKKKLIV
jgi:hypothetical protein